MSDLPKVLIIHHSGILGGAGRSMVDLAAGLMPDFEVSAYLPAAPGDLAVYLQDRDVKGRIYGFRMAKIPHYSGGEKLWHPRMWYYALSIFRQRAHWRRVIERENPDIVIANSSVIAWLSLVLVGARRPSVLMVRETLRGRRDSVVNRLLRRLRERFTFVVYLSDFDRDLDDLRSASSLVIPDAVAPEDYEDTLGKLEARRVLGIPNVGSVALFLGGSNRLKGLDVLLEAMTKTRTKDLHLVVGGNAPVAGRLRSWYFSPHRRFDRHVLRLLSKSGVRDRVTFVGVREDVTSLYSACDFVVFPMKQPHQARPAFEAGFQSKPVVITDFPNIRGCVRHEVNGLVFAPGRTDQLAECLDRLATNPQLTERLGAENRRHAIERHDQASAFEPLRSVLAERVLQARRRRNETSEGIGDL